MVDAAVADSASSSPEGALRPAPLDAPAALWSEFSPPLRAFLARRVPPGVEADDLLQDVFLRVVRHLGSLRASDRLEAWLFQIARNALRDSLRARQRRDGRTDSLDIDVPAEFTADADHAAEAELAPCLTAMVAQLPEPYRSAITLTSIQGLTQAEAAPVGRGLTLGHEVSSAAWPGAPPRHAGALLRNRRGREGWSRRFLPAHTHELRR